MTTEPRPTVLPAHRVRREAATVRVQPGASAEHAPMTVVPIPGEHGLEGFEVRCGCGSRVVIDCSFEATEQPTESTESQTAEEDSE